MTPHDLLPRTLLLVACLWPALAPGADDRAEIVRLQGGGQPEAALQRADALLARQPRDPQVRFLRGVLLGELQRRDEAVDVFERLVEDYPELPEPYNNLATLHASAGDYDKARQALEQALRANPAFALAHQNLGDVHAALAERAYARALQLDPSNAGLAPRLALVRQLLASPERAGAPGGPPR